ncbi:MAG: hypothetical protein IKR76_09055, partial [Ruminococcus sp.]|nr:hypothetical protein [Ruminococcus sp.]
VLLAKIKLSHLPGGTLGDFPVAPEPLRTRPFGLLAALQLPIYLYSTPKLYPQSFPKVNDFGGFVKNINVKLSFRYNLTN